MRHPIPALLAAGALLVVAGEAQALTQKDVAAAEAKMNAAIQVCNEHGPARGGSSSHVMLVRCSDNAVLEYFQAISFPWMDLVYEMFAARVQTAEQADQGLISPEVFTLRLMAEQSRFAQERDQRLAEQRAATAQAAQPQADADRQYLDDLTRIDRQELDDLARIDRLFPPSVTTTCSPNRFDGSFTCETQ